MLLPTSPHDITVRRVELVEGLSEVARDRQVEYAASLGAKA